MNALLKWAIGPALPWLGLGLIIALGLGAWTINDRAVDRTTIAVDAKWQKLVANEQAKVRKLEHDWQDEHNKAEAADVRRQDAQNALMAALQQKVTAYVQSPEGRACGLDPAGGLLINEAVAAANRTVAAGAASRR